MEKLENNNTKLQSELYQSLGLEELDKGIATFPRILEILANVLEKLIEKNRKLLRSTRKRETVTVFHSSRAASVSVRQYLERIFKYSSCSVSCFVAAYIYIDRYVRRTDVYITSLNVHRLLITSVMVAAKFMDDDCYSNSYYAKVGGVTTKEMNKLELNFLFDLDFKLYVTKELFDEYCRLLNKEGANKDRLISQTMKAIR